MKKRLLAWLQVVLAVGLMTYLFFNMENKADLLNAVRAIAGNWPYLVLALALCPICFAATSLRWKLILDAHGFKLPFARVFTLFLIGHFFNAFLFGANGGDLMKAVLLGQQVKSKRTEAVSTVFIDRLIGVCALIGLSAVLMIVRFRLFMAYPQTRATFVLLGAILGATAVVLLAAFRHNVFERWAIFKRLEERTKLGALISRVYNAFHLCLRHPGLLTKTVLLSLANHILLVGCAFVLGSGLEIRTVHPPEPDPGVAVTAAVEYPTSTRAALGSELRTGAREFANYVTVFPIINAVASVPATPGGLGTREAVAAVLLGIPAFGVPETRAIPLSLLMYGIMVVWSLAGGVAYIVYTYRLIGR